MEQRQSFQKKKKKGAGMVLLYMSYIPKNDSRHRIYALKN